MAKYDDDKKKKKKTSSEKLTYAKGQREKAASTTRSAKTPRAKVAAKKALRAADNLQIKMDRKVKSEAAQSAFKDKDYNKIKGKTGSY